MNESLSIQLVQPWYRKSDEETTNSNRTANLGISELRPNSLFRIFHFEREAVKTRDPAQMANSTAEPESDGGVAGEIIGFVFSSLVNQDCEYHFPRL